MALTRRGLLKLAAVMAPGLVLISESEDTQAIRAGSYCLDTQEWAMLYYINKLRLAYGRPMLVMSAYLAAAAEHHARDMAAHDYFSHTLSNGVTWSQNITNHGYPTGTYRAENIAAGNPDALSTYRQWAASYPHRANMMSYSYRAVGIGRAYSATSRYGWYWVTTFGSVRTWKPC